MIVVSSRRGVVVLLERIKMACWHESGKDLGRRPLYNSTDVLDISPLYCELPLATIFEALISGI